MQILHRAIEQDLIRETHNDMTVDYNESGRLTMRFLPDEDPTMGFQDFLINFTIPESNQIIAFCSKISRLGYSYDKTKD